MTHRLKTLIITATIALLIGLSQASDVQDLVVSTPDSTISAEVHTLPETTPKTALIVIGGSVARTRADTRPALSFLLNSEVAVVLYDRRGNGFSQGQFQTPSTENTEWLIPALARDISAMADELKSQGFLAVGLVGSSMGSWVSIAAAASSKEIDFIVCLSGTANSVAVSDRFSDLIEQGLTLEQAADQARGYAKVPSYDPADDLQKLSQPAFWVLGAKDRSNPTVLDKQVIESHIADGKAFELMILENASHEFTDVDSGDFIADWIQPVMAFIARSAQIE